jgi:hypothetical protein
MSWNLADICEKCHRIIHHAGSDSEIILKIKYDYKLKNNAVKRYHGKYKKELENLIKLVKFKYDNIKRNSTID